MPILPVLLIRFLMSHRRLRTLSCSRIGSAWLTTRTWMLMQQPVALLRRWRKSLRPRRLRVELKCSKCSETFRVSDAMRPPAPRPLRDPCHSLSCVAMGRSLLHARHLHSGQASSVAKGEPLNPAPASWFGREMDLLARLNLPADADIEPPKNVLFVCKLNPVTEDEDLDIIFGRFGNILSCEVRLSRTLSGIHP